MVAVRHTPYKIPRHFVVFGFYENFDVFEKYAIRSGPLDSRRVFSR
jgi:hypothetical protein